MQTADSQRIVRRFFEALQRLKADKKHLYVACADHWLQIDELQQAGKKRMDAASFLNGFSDIEKYSVV